MKNMHKFAIVFLLMSVAVLACGSSTPTEPTPQAGTDVSIDPNAEPTTIQISSTPTAAELQLEIVQFQAWSDYQENVRANVLLRNPNNFPVGLRSRSAVLKNAAGEVIQEGSLYFLDGISGGGGFILPQETVAANVCFTCEEPLLTEEWASVNFSTKIEDATDRWKYSTEVEVITIDVSFEGDSPTFGVTGTLKNNTDSTLDRISARIFVFDQEGKLVGAAEASAWEVGPGATVEFSGYGIGKTPAGPVKYESSALGVTY